MVSWIQRGSVYKSGSLQTHHDPLVPLYHNVMRAVLQQCQDVGSNEVHHVSGGSGRGGRGSNDYRARVSFPSSPSVTRQTVWTNSGLYLRFDDDRFLGRGRRR